MSSDAELLATATDLMFDQYGEWLNKMLFGEKGESDYVIWLGDGRWQVGSYEAPRDVFLVELHRAEVRRV